MYKLRRFNISIFDGRNSMLGMHRWFILCDNGSLSSDGRMCIGLVFSLVSICLLELCGGHLLSVFIILSLLVLFSRHFCFKHRGQHMHGMLGWLILCNDWTFGCDGSMRCRLLFSCISNCVLELLLWNVPSVHGDDFMSCVYGRLLLLNDGLVGGIRRLYCWVL